MRRQIFEGLNCRSTTSPTLSAGDEFADVHELYASARFYEGFDLTHFDEANDLALAHLLPALKALGRIYFAQFALQ